jgi:D-amino-acid dehydrogenase
MRPVRPLLFRQAIGSGERAMRVLVLGSGVVGVTSAYYLARAGHEVTVVDRQPGAGLETSFANAGQVSFGYSAPWAAPGIPVKAIGWLLMHYRPLVLWPQAEARFWSWLVQMLANCTEDAYARNKARMVRVAEYARTCLRELRAETGIEYDHRERGTLQLFRTQKQLDHVGSDTGVLSQFGVPWEVLDPAGCIAAEPALAAVRDHFVGGLRLREDETGDAHVFTQRLAALTAERGVTYRYSTTISAIGTEGDRVSGVVTDAGTLTADAYVMAMGSFSPLILRRIGIDIPVYPVKGYSITVPITDAAMAPVSTVMDETYKVAITRLGDRIRVGGTAELAGYSTRLRTPRRRTLEHSVADLFPQGGDLSRASFWTGLRPMTPDGTPVIGPTRLRNLWTNTGHGTLGWTMSCGSGKLLADLVSGRTPEIDHTDLAASRYH